MEGGDIGGTDFAGGEVHAYSKMHAEWTQSKMSSSDGGETEECNRCCVHELRVQQQRKKGTLDYDKLIRS